MKINKKVLLLAILFFLAEILKVEILFCLILMIILFKAVKNNIPCRIFKVNFEFIVILMLGMIIGLIYISTGQYEIRDYIRDIVRIGTPLLLISFGTFSFKSDKIRKIIYQGIVYGGILLSIRHLILVAINIGYVILKGSSRGMGGMQSGTTILALVILLFGDKENIETVIKNNLIKYCIVFLLIISDLLYFSRTDIITFLCFFIIFLCYKFVKFLKNGVNIGKVTKTILLLIFFIGIVYLIIPKGPLNTLIGKFSNIINEVSASKNGIWTYSQINTDWRGYEVYRAKLEYKNANLFNKFIGFGFGKKVKLGLSMKLGSTAYSEIPILHNGYYYLLIKTGGIGIVLFLLFILKNFIINFLKMLNGKNQLEYMLLSGICLSILLTTYAVTGAFNPSIAFSFFVLYGYIDSYIYINS